MKRLNKLSRPACLLFAASFGLALGACGPHSEYRIEKVCEDFCARAVDCNDNTDYDDCLDDCIGTAHDCDSDSDVEQSLDLLEVCADESCNDVPGCALNAWLECAF